MLTKKYKTVKEFTDPQDQPQKKLVQQLHNAILDAAPEAEAVISYNMPAFKLNGILVYYNAYEHHIGFYCMPSAVTAFRDELQNYKLSKGTIQFPLDKNIPAGLVKKIVKFRVKENLEKLKSKKKKQVRKR